MPPTSANLHHKTSASATFAATLAVFADLLAILVWYFPDTYPLRLLHLAILIGSLDVDRGSSGKARKYRKV